MSVFVKFCFDAAKIMFGVWDGGNEPLGLLESCLRHMRAKIDGADISF